MIERRGQSYDVGDIERFLEDRVQESSVLDYKADPHLWPGQTKPTEKLAAIIAKAVCAFANSGGGLLLVGVDEDSDGYPVRTSPPGVPARLSNDPIVERVDRIITRHVFPRPPANVFSAPIAETDRAYVLVEVAPRGGGPHRVVETKDGSLDDRYFVRLGRSSVIADHYHLRQLFNEAGQGEKRVLDYMLESVGAPNVQRRPPASLISSEPNRASSGIVIVTVMPDVLRGDIIDVDDSEVFADIFTSKGPLRAFGEDERPTIEGRSIESPTDTPPLLRSYIRLHRNGYIEGSHAATYASDARGSYVMVDAVQAILEPLLVVAKRLYELVGVRDRALVGVHVRAGPNDKLGRRIAGAGLTGKGRADSGQFGILLPFQVGELDQAVTRAQLDRRLANAYGIEEGMALFPDGRKRPADIFYTA